MDYALRWLTAFVFTQLVEMGIYTQAVRHRPTRERIAIAFGASAITHPLVWYLFPDLGQAWHLAWWPTVALAETFAVVVETLWLAAFGVPRAFLWALAANGVSFSLGLFAYTRLGW